MPLDPVIAQVLEMGKGAPALERLSPAEAREAMRARVGVLAAFAPKGGTVENLTMPGPGGDITLRLIRPDTPGPHPLVLFYHGGGWVVCDLDTHEAQARRLALGSGAAVLMVDYRLAPEARFPAAVLDSVAALNWAVVNADTLKIDAKRIAVAGDSAGGNLAAVVALKARDRGIPLAAQLLIYPVTAYPDDAYPSYAENDSYGLTGDNMRWYWKQYLGSTAVPTDPDAVPIAADVAGVASALVLTAEYDVLRDEGEAYAARLRDAGVAVELRRSPGLIHGFLALAGMVGGATTAADEAAAWLGAQLAA